ncbi:probable ribonuclease ZC3H12C isoform X3 [Myotis daubentonii]|uniref:probable ribonuclease ZC3H12C isoform X3 n=1 Tax=Myotis daubentonii TaxID=98922 RepID=UPI002872ED64|nr:probable ribonuclease ZC3H12C isoform X3 [Myotis daubentonii]
MAAEKTLQEYGVLCIQEYRKSSKVESGTRNSFMGLKDHLGHDLGHLCVESTDPHLSTSVPWPMVEKPTMDKVNSGKAGKEVSEENASSGDSEESTNSDHESEQLSSISVEPCLLTKTHRQLCRSPCLEPHVLKGSEILQDLTPEEPQTTSKEVKKPPDVVREYQTKLEFALKLGYSEEQVQLVLNKLGTDALINDILGELVKLGNKSEAEQTVSTVNSIMRETSSLESQRSDSPMQEIVTDDGENLRPIVIDGSNVAMRFMPPDDPLGRHGPSLDNFLRKKPIVPEHKKQPCPYGKKCTYGHKCKYYHPERGSQPQRSVADELRAMSRNTAAKTANEGGLVKSNSVPCSTKADSSADGKRGAPKRQSDPSIRTQAYPDLEEKLPTKNKLETRSVPSLVSIPATSTAKPQSTTSLSNGLPSGVHFPPQDQRPPGQYPPIMMTTKNHGTPMPYEQYPKCDSPVDIGYYSMLNAYSNLSISGPRSPERRFSLDTDYRISSVASDCSSDGSMSCGSSDSYVGYNDRSYVSSPDPQLEENLKCQHMYPHSRLNSQPFLQNFHDPLTRVQSYSHEEPKYHHKPPLPHLAVHLQHPAVGARSSCPGEYPSPPSSAHKAPHLGRSLVATRLDSISDSRLYDSSPSRQRKPYSRQEGLGSWDRQGYGIDTYGYRQTYSLPDSATQPCYEQFTFQSLPEQQEPPWRIPSCGLPQDPPRYPDNREKIYINLCNIFPPDLVRTVMKRNPHVTDAQQLAAAILVEKSQLGY